ncbi:hypothetical protein RB200_28775 [Streptomyces sp. PmtG]
MRRRLVSLAMLGSVLATGLGLAGAGTAAAAAPVAKANETTVTVEQCIAGGGKIVWLYIHLGCQGGTHGGLRIGG